MVALPDPLNQLSSAPPPQLHSPNTIIGVGHRRRLACCPMFDKSLLAGASEAASPSSAPRAALSAAPSVSANVLILVEFVSTTGRGPCALRPYSQQQVFGFSVPAVRRGSLVNLAAPWLRSVLRRPVVVHLQFSLAADFPPSRGRARTVVVVVPLFDLSPTSSRPLEKALCARWLRVDTLTMSPSYASAKTAHAAAQSHRATIRLADAPVASGAAAPFSLAVRRTPVVVTPARWDLSVACCKQSDVASAPRRAPR